MDSNGFAQGSNWNCGMVKPVERTRMMHGVDMAHYAPAVDCADTAMACSDGVSSGNGSSLGMHDNRQGNAALRLGAWWEANARDLPWRFGRATPWGVLVSEVMSQQTQMSRVVPYWTDWMERWPDARALAEAPKAEVITAWGRLGYPRRALRLQECARVVAEQYADKLPRTYDELTALPGIGDYTASAVMSFAFGERIAVIDTNIRRVLSRVFLGVESRGGATSPAERALANRMLPKDEILGCDADVADNAGSAEHVVNSTIRGGKRSRLHRGERPSVTWNQSVMELGAVICTAKSPLCDTCPIADDCAFLKAGRPGLGERRTRPRQRFQGTDRTGARSGARRAARASRWSHVAQGRCRQALEGPDSACRLHRQP